MRVFLRKEGNGTFTLGFQTPAPEDLTFRVAYFGYLPELSAPADESPLANAYPEMVIAKAKSLALASVNDGASTGLEALSEQKFKEASFSEARADLQGRDLHM